MFRFPPIPSLFLLSLALFSPDFLELNSFFSSVILVSSSQTSPSMERRGRERNALSQIIWALVANRGTVTFRFSFLQLMLGRGFREEERKRERKKIVFPVEDFDAPLQCRTTPPLAPMIAIITPPFFFIVIMLTKAAIIYCSVRYTVTVERVPPFPLLRVSSRMYLTFFVISAFAYNVQKKGSTTSTGQRSQFLI